MRALAENLEVAGVPYVEVVSEDLGGVVAANTVEVSPCQYRYEVTYDKHGNIDEARSWNYDPESDETTFTRFDADGNQLSRFVKCSSLGTTRMYNEANKLESSSHVENDGKLITRFWYGAEEKPISSSVIDREANTHTMTLFQSDGTQFVRVTPWEGPGGWTSTVYPPRRFA